MQNKQATSSHAPKLLMLVANTFMNDARVERSIALLQEKGCHIQLLAYQHKNAPLEENNNGFSIKRLTAQARQETWLPWYARKCYAILRRTSRYLDTLLSLLLLEKKTFFNNHLKEPSERLIYKIFNVRVRRKRYFHFAKLCQEIAIEYQPDLIYAHDFPCLIAAGLIHRELKIPFIYDSHELWLERNLFTNRIFHDKKWECQMERTHIANAAAVITVCNSIADHLSKFFNIQKPHIVRNIPQKTVIKKNNLREIFSLKPSDFLTVYIGKATFNRGITDILNALPHTPAQVKFVCIGYFDKNFKILFKKLVKKNGLQNRVFTFGPVDTQDVVHWAADADLSLTTMSQSCLSYFYTLPNKLFESLHAELPILGPNSPEIINIVNTYECGMTYVDGNARDLAEKICLLKNSPDKLAIMKEKAKQAAAILCWQNEKAALAKVYDSVLAE